MAVCIKVKALTKEETLEIDQLVELFIKTEHEMEEGESLVSDNFEIKRMRKSI